MESSEDFKKWLNESLRELLMKHTTIPEQKTVKMGPWNIMMYTEEVTFVSDLSAPDRGAYEVLWNIIKGASRFFHPGDLIEYDPIEDTSLKVKYTSTYFPDASDSFTRKILRKLENQGYSYCINSMNVVIW